MAGACEKARAGEEVVPGGTRLCREGGRPGGRGRASWKEAGLMGRVAAGREGDDEWSG